jgi:Trk K+ transport system NAD-binding subunit
MAGHVIVCGMGQVGYRVVDLLWRLGEAVSVVALPTRDDWLQDVRRRGVEVLIGDARDPVRLQAAGLRDAAALIAATDQDLVNLEIVLTARELCPHLPVVVRLFDQTLARQLEASFDVRRAVGMSALAAPAFAASALGEQVIGSFAVEQEQFVVGRLNVDGASRLADRTVEAVGAEHDLAVLSHAAADAPSSLGPAAQTRLAAGDAVTIVGHTSSWNRATGGGSASPAARAGGAAGSWRSAAVAFARQVWSNTSPGLRTVFLVLNLLIALSVVVFHLAMGLEWEDALYFVITTVTTTGYGDITVRDTSLGLKLYACLLMVLGSATIATFYSIITDFIVTWRFRQLFGQQRMPHEDHIIVVGLGNVGFRIVNELRRAGIPTVGVQLQAAGEFVEAIRAHTPVLHGDARLSETLRKAGTARARAVVAVTEDDTVNISVGLAAERVHPGVRTVVRLLDANLAQKVQSALTINVALSAGQIAAPTFVAAALYPDVRYAFMLGDCLAVIRHHAVGAAWVGLTPSRVRAEHGAIILMRGGVAGREYTPAHDDAPLTAAEYVLTVAQRRLVS